MSYGVALALLVGSYCAHRLYMLYGCVHDSWCPSTQPPPPLSVSTTDTERSAGSCLLQAQHSPKASVPVASVTLERAQR